MTKMKTSQPRTILEPGLIKVCLTRGLPDGPGLKQVCLTRGLSDGPGLILVCLTRGLSDGPGLPDEH